MTKSPSAPRRRGGQPGNRNAVRHGFYARYLPELPALPPAHAVPDRPDKYIEETGVTVSERRDPFNRLDDEVAMLRLAVRNIAARSSQPLPLAEELELLRAINLAGAAINRLLRTQELLYQPIFSFKLDPNFSDGEDGSAAEDENGA